MKLSFTRSIPRGFLLIFFFIAACSVRIQAQEFFLPLKNTGKQDEYKVAYKIYFQLIAKNDDSVTEKALKQLEMLADNENNAALKTIFLAFMGDYYCKHLTVKAHQYLNEALPKAIAYNLKQLQADIYTNMGLTYYYINHDYKQGFEYMLKANAFIEKEIGFENYLSAGSFLNKLGSMYYDFGNIAKARTYLFKSINYPESTLSAVQIYNTIALSYREENNLDSAAAYLIKAAALAEANNLQFMTGLTKGNLGSVYYSQGKLEEARPLIQTDLALSIASKEWGSAANTLSLYADISIRENDLSKASRELDSASLFYQRQSQTPLYRYYTTRVLLFKLQGNYSKALVYLDSAKNLQDSFNKKNNSLVYSRIEENIQMEKYLADKKLMAIENKRLVLVRNFIIILLVLITVIAVQFILRLYVKRKKEGQLMKLAKDQLEYYVGNLRTKNEMIDEFQKEIERLNHLPGYMLQKEKDEMSTRLKEYTILTETHWNEFRQLFEKVHTGFFEKLRLRYNNLTQSEIRLLALLRLNLSKREMAEMLGISPDSVKKTRQRIQQKIELPENKQLEEMVLMI